MAKYLQFEVGVREAGPGENRDSEAVYNGEFSFFILFINSINLIYFDVELLNMSLPKIRLLK